VSKGSRNGIFIRHWSFFQLRLSHCFIVLLLITSAFLLPNVAPAWAQDPTVPTRTPTPDPNAPAATEDGTDALLPTGTAEARATATGTREPGASVAPPSAGQYILPALGVGLVGLGLLVGLLARRRGRVTSGSSDESESGRR
jgi:hypothetical protein